MNKFIIVSISIVILFLLGCDSDKPTMPAGTVSVTGAVMANYFAMPDEYNDSLDSEYYTVQTGLPARIDLLQEDEVVYSVKTNMLSRFSLAVEPGEYSMITYTEHDYPRHYPSFYIENDTTMILGTHYIFRVIDSVLVTFTYSLLPRYDIIFTPQQELEYLNQLNGLVDGIMITDRAKVNRYTVPDSSVYVSDYTIPIVENIMTYDAFGRVSMILRPGMHLPHQMIMGVQTHIPWIWYDFYIINPDDFIYWDSFYHYFGDGNYDPPESLYYYDSTIYYPPDSSFGFGGFRFNDPPDSSN